MSEISEFRDEMREILLGMDKRFDSMDKRFDSMDKRLDRFESQTSQSFCKIRNALIESRDNMCKRFDRLEERIDIIESILRNGPNA